MANHIRLSSNATRQISLLETLCVLNSNNVYPISAGLVRADAVGTHLTRAGRTTRVRLVAYLRAGGLIKEYETGARGRKGLVITSEGVNELRRIREGKR